jgi:hypothetical protein
MLLRRDRLGHNLSDLCDVVFLATWTSPLVVRPIHLFPSTCNKFLMFSGSWFFFRCIFSSHPGLNLVQ